MSGNGRFDIATVKTAARGRWADILSAAGIPREHLDGRHYPCPKCGGTDRFRLVDVAAGAVLCSRCFSAKNGDGLAAVQWIRDCKFYEALRFTAEQIGLAPQDGHDHYSHTVDPLDALCHAKRMSKECALAYGARVEAGAVAFPSWGPSGSPRSDFTIRPTGTDRQRKGMWPKGGKAGVFLPVVDGKPRLPQPGETWIVVEGVKDSSALHGLGCLALGMPTCKLSQKAAGMFRGCHVVFLPDRDTAGIEGAEANARKGHGIAASQRIGHLPAEVKPSGGADVRDILAQEDGEQLVRDAIEQAQPWELPEDENKSTGGIIAKLADEICNAERFAQDAGGKLYRFTEGVYKSGGEEFVRRRVKALLREWIATEGWTRALGENVVEFVRVDSPLLWERPPLDVLNVQNGLLDVGTKQLRPHDPAHLSPVQLPVDYDPKAKCPCIETFVGDVFPADAIPLAWEIPAYLMLPDTAIQKAVLLIGPGGNGKSTWLEMLVRFLGRGSVSALSLHKLEADRFSAARLHGKLANICPDLPSEHLAGTSVFKSITGGDCIAGEYKYKDSFEFTPFCRLVFSANNPPRSQDSSQGFFERWHVIPFERSFRGTDAEVSRTILDARLSAPAELSGLLNKALAALPRIQSGKGFTQGDSTRRAWQEFHATTDPLAVWLDRFTIDDPSAVAVKKTLRVAFNSHLELQGKPAMTDTAFGREIARQRPRVTTAQRTVSGRVQWCYVGIGLLSDIHGESQASQGSQRSPHCYLPREAHRQGEQEEKGEGEQENNNRANPVNPVNPVSEPGVVEEGSWTF